IERNVVTRIQIRGDRRTRDIDPLPPAERRFSSPAELPTPSISFYARIGGKKAAAPLMRGGGRWPGRSLCPQFKGGRAFDASTLLFPIAEDYPFGLAAVCCSSAESSL
ncbi:MAG: hypothetical protein ACREIA_11955, partial [Opitutaceae bacterium]